jgi:hypothetical protein
LLHALAKIGAASEQAVEHDAGGSCATRSRKCRVRALALFQKACKGGDTEACSVR